MEVLSRDDKPDLHEMAAAVFTERWPEFIFHDEIPKKYMSRVGQYFGRVDVMVLDGTDSVEGRRRRSAVGL